MPKTRLSNREIFARVWEWQTAGYVHPLTCRINSSHPVLKPELKGGKVVLVCPECDYVQEHIPKAVLKGVPPLPAIAIGPKRNVTVIISKSAWEALLAGKKVAVLRVFSEGELHHEFGDNPEEFIVRVKITPVTS